MKRLEKICTEEGGNFYMILNGNVYCSLAWSRRIDCKHLADKPDHNGFYPCTYKPYLEIRDELMEGVEYV